MDSPTTYPQPEADTSTPTEEDELIILDDEKLDNLSIFVDPHEAGRASAPMLNWVYLKRNGFSGGEHVAIAVRHYATA